jgi:phage anti-repressor protein
MTSIVKQDIANLIDGWLEQESKGVQFPVPFDLAWQIAGYSEKGKGKRRLTSKSSYLSEGQDYLIEKGVYSIAQSGKSELCGRSSDLISMSCDAFKHFCLMAETEQGRQIRQYFIEAEKRWRVVQRDFPAVAAQVEQSETDKLILLEQLRLKNKEKDDAMLQMHGRETVLALRGCQDQLITREITVTEVVEPATGTSTKILSADQLKKAIKDRTGQKLKSLKDFADALRNAGRDDLLIPVTRHQTYEYPIPEKLDEAIAIVYGNHRQRLIGE